MTLPTLYEIEEYLYITLKKKNSVFIRHIKIDFNEIDRLKNYSKLILHLNYVYYLMCKIILLEGPIEQIFL